MTNSVKILPQCEACQAREQCIFGDLPESQFDAFAQIRHYHSYKARQVLFHEGTPALGFHIACTGRVKISRADSNGREQILRIADPGDILGEEAILDTQPYGATAEALEECHTAFIKRPEFLALIQSAPVLGQRLLLHLCRTLVETQGRLARMGLGDARCRLAGTLLDLARRYGKPATGGTDVDVSLSRAELAAMVGLSPETAMRLLSEFKDDGLVRLDGRRITVLGTEKLAGLSGL